MAYARRAADDHQSERERMNTNTNSKESIGSKPYKPALRELRLAAISERLALPEHAGFLYWAMVNVLSARHAGVHLDRVVEWFKALGEGRGRYEEPVLDWATALNKAMPEVIEDAVRVLVAERLITTEVRMF